ncbi:M15 family metallopeptidase [Sphingomonas sp. TREG-RG-20F-R18-01]|uniref:M15 family metallopeptidase n=1 Tax=Sphingomonas sp. TREG-RG-20F-R18-01 TaxID=2914982 RepID=UPI001F5AC062|nr:M15 family metallopeptidase [Sphingomonas sp. TREG-RG-20F-R18-01]
MAAQTRRDLYLSVSGDVSNLQASMKAGRSVMAQFGTASVDVVSEVEQAFAKLGGGSIEQSARSMEASLSKAFSGIRRNLQAAVGTDGASAIQILNVAGAQQAAAAAEAEAAQFRVLAEAASTVANRLGDAGAAQRVLAVSYAANAASRGDDAMKLRAQADALSTVAAEARITAPAIDEVAAKHQRMGASGMIAEHVIRSMSDSMAAGQSPVRALTMEMGRITEAMTMYAQTTEQTNGAFGKFASFMGGPWGLAVSVGVAVLTPLVAKLFEGAEAEDAAAKAAKDHKAAIDALVKSEADAVMTADEKLKRDWAMVEAERQKTIAIRDTIAANLEMAKSNLRGAEGQTFGAGGGAGAGMAVSAYAGQVSDLAQQAAANKAEIARLTATARGDEGRYAKSQIEALSTPQGAIKRKYERLESDAQKEQVKTGDIAAYTATMQRLTKAREAETKHLEELQRSTRQTANDNQQKGRSVSLGEAEDIVRGVGGRVTSATRTREQQQVLYDRYKAGEGPLAARPGTSNHERGQALDVAKSPDVSLATLVEAFRARGVNLTERLDEGDHYHVAWGSKGRAGPSAEQMARRREAQERKAANDDGSYQRELAGAQDRYAKAQLGLADTAEKRFEIDIVELRYAQQQKQKERADQVKAGKLTAPQAATLDRIDGDTEKMAETAAYRKMIQTNLDIKLSGDRRDIDRQTAMLQLQDESAKTAAERRKIGLQLLALEERLLTQEANRDIASKDPARVQRGTDALAAVSAQHDMRVSQVKDRTMGPGEGFQDQIKSSVGDMNEAIQGVGVNALQGLQSGLMGVLDGTKSVAAGFGDMAKSIISDLERIAVERLIIGPLANALFGKSDGSGGGLLSNLFGGIGKHADGGHITGPGTGRSDSILSFLSNGEFVVNAAATSRNLPLLHAINDNAMPRFADGGLVGSTPIYMRPPPSAASVARGGAAAPPLVFDLRNAVMTDDLLRQMQSISAQHATQAVIGGSQMAQNDIAEHNMQQIPA